MDKESEMGVRSHFMSLALTRIRLATYKGAYLLGQLPTWVRFAFGYGILWLTHGGRVDLEAVEDLTERIVLGRPLVAEERAFFARLIAERGLNPWALPLSFFRLPGALERRVLKSTALHHHHLARMELVKKHLPPARRILDLGGAVDHLPQGSLLAMGYPHRPEEVVIIDLPDEKRLHEKTEQGLKDLTTPEGTRVRYLYGDMTDLSRFKDGEFDLVWSGQSIEHISEAQGEVLARQVLRVLRPGGAFCLDTPNNRVMRLISRHFLHPEHQIEYDPQHLASVMNRCGFDVEQSLAVSPCPIGLRLGRLSKLEVIGETRVGGPAVTGFSFFLLCRKPS